MNEVDMATIGNLLHAKSSETVIWSIKPDQTVREALELMELRDIGCVMVMENDALVGILSERDYARKMILSGKASADTAVSEIMTPGVVCVTREDSVDYCMELMSERDFRHLPVKQGENVVGMVSIRDLVGHIIKEQKDTIDHLQQYIAT